MAVGFYSEKIFPILCDLLLDKPEVARRRQQLLASVSGEILELGFGSGLNLPHYPCQVHRITTVDPNVGMHRMAHRRVRRSRIEVNQLLVSGEDIPSARDQFDCVVCTFTLCSIENVDQALREVVRVLKPGGRFLFLEHGLSPEANIEKWQHRLNWLQQSLADGCRLDRNMKQLIVAQPFSSVEVEEFYLKSLPKTHGYLYRGMSRK
jgi:ubiquinone/menaquinone biosynthesis C-methylase UbiE